MELRIDAILCIMGIISITIFFIIIFALDFHNHQKKMQKYRREKERKKELMRMYILTGLKQGENQYENITIKR